MYAGHAALALLAKGSRPRVSLALLVPVAFAPDWIEWFFDAFGQRNRMLSHSLVSVGIGATAAALIYWFARRDTADAADAAAVWLTYASHWPADFITGIKPTWPGGPDVGLMLYEHLGWDALLESVLIVIGWLVYRRSLPLASRRRAIGGLIPIGLIAMELITVAIQDPGMFHK